MNSYRNTIVTLLLVCWLCFAVGLSGWFRNASAPAVAATVWTLTVLVLVACWKITAIRVWVLDVDLRWLVLFHLTRSIAGAYFLVLCRRGELPCAFASPAGWGDLLVGVFALVIAAPPRAEVWRVPLLIWNVVGLLDIVFVVFSALRFGLQDWQSMHALRELPLSLLPTFLVPLIIASHVLFCVRGAQARDVR